jgi:NTE family protein
LFHICANKMTEEQTPSRSNKLAVVLTGGGARAAYQVGVLRAVAKRYPDTQFDIITGVSAGAINALFLASHPGALGDSLQALCRVWESIEVEDIFRVDAWSLARHLAGWSARLVSGGSRAPLGPRVRGLMDTAPLRRLLARALPHDINGVITGVAENVDQRRPDAVAITTLDYTTGQTVTWVDGQDIEVWERPLRRSVRTHFTIDHVMASAALPILFPAVRLVNSWYGDGGMRLSAPLSPALHLGADRVLAISTHYAKSFHEAEQPETLGYPPPAQILGQIMNAVFLDVMDEDALRLERSNAFLREMPESQRRGYRLIDLLVVRPSQDLGKLVTRYEPLLPRGFRFLMRSLGTRETSSPDFLSLLMFQPDYLQAMIRIGAEDGEARMDEIGRLIQATHASVDPADAPANVTP